MKKIHQGFGYFPYALIITYTFFFYVSAYPWAVVRDSMEISKVNFVLATP
jgi:hypothetical protein